MVAEILAVVAVAALCGGWVLLQRAVAEKDPDQPGVEGARCGSCREDCEERCHDRS